MSTKITFSLPAEVVADATSGLVLGEFNGWDSDKAASLIKQKDGSMKATVTLEPGTYQYRYLLDDVRWVNDHIADKFVHVDDLHVENCVITVPDLPAEKEDFKTTATITKKAEPVTKAEPITKPEPTKKAEPSRKAEPAKKTETAKKPAPIKKAEPTTAKSNLPKAKDDLTKIEGIGKKIAEMLADAGMATFEELSKSTTKDLRTILDTAGNKFKITDPSAWPKQAKLAAAGKWPELKKLQSESKKEK